MPSREEKQWQHHETAKRMRKTRKEIKRNRKPKRARHKAWNSYNYEDLDALNEIDLPQSEPMMPRGERERWRANLKRVVEVLEVIEDLSEETPSLKETHGLQGIVVEVSSSLCRVDVGERSLICSLRGSLTAEESGYTNVVAVGDEVIVSENGSDEGVVETVLPRRSVLARPDVFYSHL
jgi:hypothetical protein